MRMAVPFALLASGLALSVTADVKIKGYLGHRLDSMIEHHVIGTDVDYITAPFMEKTEREGRWQTEFWGKYMHSAVPYLDYSKSVELRSSIERGVDRILASQEECGYIGNYPERLRCGEGWDVWGMKYTMMGLLHYYDACKDQKRAKTVLEACKRLCDYVRSEIGPEGTRGCELWQTGNWSGYASSSILEPVVWLYRRTKDKSYLDFATFIVRGMTDMNPKGPRLLDLAQKGVSVADRNEGGVSLAPETDDWAYVRKYGRGKAYEMMSCYQGLLEYYEVTGRCDLYDATLSTAKDIVREEINLAGGCSSTEAWYHGARKQHQPYAKLQETCVTTTWMRLCEKLLELTDNPFWADQIERTFYNAYLAAMKSDGAEFAGYTPLSGCRYHGQHHCFMHVDCCTANGPRGFLCFLRELCRVRNECVTFNFYTTALVREMLPSGRDFAFDMYSLYPRSDSVRLVSHTQGLVPVRFRIPAWSSKTAILLNGSPLEGVKAGSYFTISRDWSMGDVVEIKFEMPAVAHVCEHHVAFTRGPILLARDSRLGQGDFTEPFRYGICDGDVLQNFDAVRTPSDDFWMSFSAVLPIGSHHENPEARNPATVVFCDYASAGNSWQDNNYYRTWFPIERPPESR